MQACFGWGRVAILCLGLGLTGCVMDSSRLKAPSTLRTVSLAASAGTERVFGCAESTLNGLHQKDDQWVLHVTRKDFPAGVLETGNFPEENEMGFRFRLSMNAADGVATLEFKGAGPYFMDIGVEAAAQRFAHSMTRCLQDAAKS